MVLFLIPVLLLIRFVIFGLIDSQGRLNVDLQANAANLDVGGVKLEDGADPSKKATVDSHGSLQSVIRDISGSDAVGSQGTGASYNPPAGGSAILGYLSGIFKAITGALPGKAAVLTQVTGGITASGQSVTATGLDGYDGMTFSYAGTYATGSSLQFEASNDGGANWASIFAVRLDNGVAGTSVGPTANAAAVWSTYLSGCTQFRIRCSAWGSPSGTINITMTPFASSEEPAPQAILTTSTGGIIGTGTGSDASSATNPLQVAAFPDGYNGSTYDRLRTLSAAGDGLGVQLSAQPSSTPVSQSATHAANTITIAATAAQRNRLTHLSGSVSGSGTMPTAAAPLTLQVKDGSTVILALDITGAGPFNVNLPPSGLKGTVNTAMTAAFGDGGTNVTTTITVGTLTA